MTPAEREALRALAAKATPGPWTRDDQDHRTEVVSADGVVVCDLRDHTQGDDAAFVAACRAAVPALLSALSDAEADRDTWRSVADDLGAERDRLRERVRLAEVWLAADDAADRVQQSSTAAYNAREAFRASKGGDK